MKKICLIVLFGLAAATAYAQTGGFSGPDGRPLVTALEVQELADDTHVRLVGYIVRKTGDEEYEFKDDSGTLIVEIDDDDWHGLEVSPTDKVELTGEVDKERTGNTIDVDSIRLVK
ncbi:MAG TPA: NirD/YgiW/YdeI family stress tolerance protein [Woeseiaceae bacterium]|nr:NirD/YgiW/YdeI family stress tolerance protein [Woeseiaceae bacterium]